MSKYDVQTAPELRAATDTIVIAVDRLTARLSRPVLLALDGRSGSGKSTLARLVATKLDSAVVPGDDFFAAQITDVEWDARTASERAADAIDWRRLRDDALEPLLAGRAAKWHAFDFVAGTRPDGTYATCADASVREPRRVVILDGAYSTRSELADLIDLSVLVDAPVRVCHDRLAAREEAQFLARWHARWDAAEEWYFTQVRPRSAFDLVVTTALAVTPGCDFQQ